MWASNPGSGAGLIFCRTLLARHKAEGARDGAAAAPAGVDPEEVAAPVPVNRRTHMKRESKKAMSVARKSNQARAVQGLEAKNAELGKSNKALADENGRLSSELAAAKAKLNPPAAA